MICFNCGYKFTSEDIQECPLCGMKFSIKCPACRSLNPKMARYCFNCGSKIEGSDDVNSVQNNEMLSESRKNVAVMFADVSGFTALSERMDPEEVREIINDCFDYITRPVYELEGTIDKYIGDCIMVLFGARYSHSDDPERAVLCALRMMDSIKQFSREKLWKKGLDLSLSIGINYGLVVTGGVGNYYDRDYTVMGDTVNTAQRLQSTAGKDTILVSESVMTETGDIQYSNGKEVMLKNKQTPVKCFTPLYVKENGGAQSIPIIGRDKELKQLGELYSKGISCINIVGEPGIGKTSLVKKYLSSLDRSTRIIVTDCSSMFQNRAYHLISNIILSILNLNSSENAVVKRNRLLTYTDYIMKSASQEEKKKTFNFLSLVLGLERDPEFSAILNSMEYNDIKIEIAEEVVNFFDVFCGKDRPIFYIDNAQWADTVSISLVSEIIKSYSFMKPDDPKPLFIFSSIYEIEGLKQSEYKNYVMQIQKLNKTYTHELLCTFLGCTGTDDKLLEAAYQFTEGNPLYIRGFAISIKTKIKYAGGSALGDAKLMKSLPKNIEGIILGSLSNLDAGAMEFLRAASIMGREFNSSWVRNMLGMDMDYVAPISKLEQMNIISLVSVIASHGKVERVYKFNQNTTRDAVYSSMLNSRKQELHARCGEFIECTFSKHLEQYYEMLAIHFESAGLGEKAGKYYFQTALKYRKDFLFQNSLSCYSKFLETADKNSSKESEKHMIDALIDIGYIYTELSNFDTALEFLNKAAISAVLPDDVHTIDIMISNIYKKKGQYDEALSILNRIQLRIKHESSLYGKLLQLKCSIYSILGKQEALDLAQESESILLETGDFESLAETMRQAAYIYFANGDSKNAMSILGKAYGYAGKANNPGLEAKISGNLGIIYHSSGEISKSLQFFNRSIELSKKISSLQNLILADTNLGVLYTEKGQFNKALSLFEESLKNSSRIESVYDSVVSLTNLGDLMYEVGDMEKALKYYSDSLKVSQEHSLVVEEGVNYIGMAKTNLNLGNLNGVMEILKKSYDIFTSSGEIYSLCDCFKYMSVYELRMGNLQEALRYCDESISSAEKSDSGIKKLKSLRLKGNILLSSEEMLNAINLYDISIKMSMELDSEYELAKGYYRKYQALKRTNNTEKAKEYLEMARETIKNTDDCRWTSIIEKND